MTLYQLTNEYMMLLSLAEDPDVDPQTLQDTMEAIGGEIEDKADGYARVMKALEADVTGLEAEIARLTDRKNAVAGNIDRLKKSLEGAMRASGKTKFKTQLFSFGIQKNGGLAPLILDRTDYEKFPEEFRKVKYEPDNQKIREYLKDHKLEWARLGERGESLRIR